MRRTVAGRTELCVAHEPLVSAGMDDAGVSLRDTFLGACIRVRLVTLGNGRGAGATAASRSSAGRERAVQGACD